MKRIEKIKNSTLGRGLFAARSAIRMLPSLLNGDENPTEMFKSLIGKSIDQFVNEVGELKGSLLKAAQILSLYGEYYLPSEVNEVLKKVQSQGHYLGWDKISPFISEKIKKDFTIDELPIAAASIGQVHRAKHRQTSKEVVLKIQYPGVKKAIDLDIKMIKSFLSLGKFLPQKMNLDPIYGEIRRVLMEEMDYELECKKHIHYKEIMANVKGIHVPEVYSEYSDDKVIVSEYIQGTSFSDLDKMNLSQAERNHLGASFFFLFFKEIFGGDLIQTDCHAGNYLYRDGELVLIDFGATLYYPEKTLTQYRELIRTVYNGEREKFFKVLWSVSDDKIELNQDLLWEYCLLAASPLSSEDFDWASTTLPDDISPKASQLMKTSRIDSPPHQFIFLDRKLLGLFSMLRLLKARFNVKAIVEDFMGKEK
jgi:predicted unusual protein kinase regulating ubiquinone biosynthesis (AarF/ABC1/UbiB family)